MKFISFFACWVVLTACVVDPRGSIPSLGLPRLRTHKNILFLVGGGGDPKGQNNFNAAARELFRRVKFDDVRAVWIDRANEAYRKEIQDIVGAPVAELTPGNIVAATDQLVADIESGKIKKDDQLLIAVVNHGIYRKEGEQTHTIVIDQVGAQTYSLDQLAHLNQVAQDHQVKVGIVDFSCYSGATLVLAGPSTCVLTAASRELVSYIKNMETFMGHLSLDVSLESAFLSSRIGDLDADLPHISTAIGMSLYELENEFNLFWISTKEDYALASERLQRTASWASPEEPFDPHRKSFEAALLKIEKQYPDLASLTQSLKQHSVQYSTLMNQLILETRRQNERGTQEFTLGGQKFPYLMASMLDVAFAGPQANQGLLALAFMAAVIVHINHMDADQSRNWIDWFEKVKQDSYYKSIQYEIAMLKQNNSSFRSSLLYQVKIGIQAEQLGQAVIGMVGFERKLYDQLYRKMIKQRASSSAASAASEACANFVF